MSVGFCLGFFSIKRGIFWHLYKFDAFLLSKNAGEVFHTFDKEINWVVFLIINARTSFVVPVAVCSWVLLGAVVVYFPSRPKRPPSVSSSAEKYEFFVALKNMLTWGECIITQFKLKLIGFFCIFFSKKKFICIWLSYSVFLGVPSAWVSVLNYSFLTFGMKQVRKEIHFTHVDCIKIFI